MIATMHKKEKKHFKKVEDHFLKCLHQKHKIDQKDANVKAKKKRKKAFKVPVVFDINGFDYDDEHSGSTTMR